MNLTTMRKLAEKTLDEIKEKLAQAFALQSNYTTTYDRNRLCDGYVAGFTVCQNLSIDKREVAELVEALKRIQKPDIKGIDGMIIADMGLKHFTEYTAEKALESFYSRHEDMRGK